MANEDEGACIANVGETLSVWYKIRTGTMQYVQLAIAVCPWLRVGILDFTLRLVECQSL